MSAKWMSDQRPQGGPTDTSYQSPHLGTPALQALSLPHTPDAAVSSSLSHSRRSEVLPALHCLLPAPKIVTHTTTCTLSPSPGLPPALPDCPLGSELPSTCRPHPSVRLITHCSGVAPAAGKRVWESHPSQKFLKGRAKRPSFLCSSVCPCDTRHCAPLGN